jgi:hypothetical protein
MANIFDRLTARPERVRTVDSINEETPDAEAAASQGFNGSRDLDRDVASAGPVSYTPRQIKDVALELLKYGLLEEQRKPNLYRTALAQHEALGRVLEPLDLAMRVDEIRGLAYVVVADQVFDSVEGEWSHPLVRRQRLNLEQSLLIAILRQQFVAHEQQAGVGSTEALIALEDLLPQLQLYLGDLGSDAQEEKRLRTLLDQLKVHGIVSEPDEHNRVAIRPIVAHLASPENLQSLLGAFRQEASGSQQLGNNTDGPRDGSGGADEQQIRAARGAADGGDA